MAPKALPHDAPLSLEQLRVSRKPLRDIKEEYENSLTRLDRLAVWITEKVGTMGFCLAIFVWTVGWTGYNIAATKITSLHWKPFDPFPAFVAYLLISNVIQILLMPLIMVGQNIQGRHSELRGENDFEVNCKAEKEIEVILMHLERQQDLLTQIVKAQGLKLDEALNIPTYNPPPRPNETPDKSEPADADGNAATMLPKRAE